jgi:hypothetical protein
MVGIAEVTVFQAHFRWIAVKKINRRSFDSLRSLKMTSSWEGVEQTLEFLVILGVGGLSRSN